MALWDDVKKNLVEWYTVTSEKTTEAARIGSRRWDKFGISRDIERQFSELGNLVYSGLKEGQEDILASQEIQGLVRRIENLEEELKAKDDEIENIKAQYRQEAAAAAAAEDEEPSGEDAAEAEEPEEVMAETVLKDPVLDRGGEESAILVEPEAEDGQESPNAEEAQEEPEKRD